MFSTFSANPSPTNRPSEQPKTAPRPKRNQVGRACDWCRLNRVKCDDKQPCENCRSRGGTCSNSKQSEAHSLPAANREILRLRTRLRDLQEQFQKATEESRRSAAVRYPSPHLSNASLSGSAKSADFPETHRKTWDGIPDVDSAQAIYYGPLSSQYLVTRLNQFMREALNLPYLEYPLPSRISLCQHPSSEPEDLSRAQEDYFLVLFWQSYHCMYPIIGEAEFRTHYDSLWASNDQNEIRQSSALVDSILAVCMQYGSTFMIEDEDESGDIHSQTDQIATAAHSFYRRSQRLLMDQLDAPSIQSLQSQIYCIIYLYNTLRLDAAHALLGMAVRTAQMLRLHLQPMEGTSTETQDLHARIWWTLYQLDSQISMTLSRPPAIHPEDVGCALPGDKGTPLQLSETMLILPPGEDITWLSFYVHNLRLTAAVQKVHSAFAARCTEVLLSTDAQDIYADLPTLESLATFMSNEVRAVYNWTQNVPQSLKVKRKDTGEAFSTGRARVHMDPTRPLWLQRQNILLELIYHHQQISIFRPFLRFPPRTGTLTPLTDGLGITALNHAMALTNLLHQILTETDLLRGWTPVFQYQWDATVCILVFILANPVCPPTPGARKCLQTALRTQELLGPCFHTATSAVQYARGKFPNPLTPRQLSQPTPPNIDSPASLQSSTSRHSATVDSSFTGLAGLDPGITNDEFSRFLNTMAGDLSSGVAIPPNLLDLNPLTPPLDSMGSSLSLPRDIMDMESWVDTNQNY